MVAQQLQHANIMPHAAANSVTLFKTTAKFGKAFRKLPIAIHIRVIECSRTSRECRQIMQRIKDFAAFFVVSSMRGDDLVVVNDFHMIDESLDGHGLESHLSRHAVAHVIEANHLVFIDGHRSPHTRFEGVTWQRC